MKTFYQLKDKTWYDEASIDEEAILHEVEVADDILIKVLNQDTYTADGFDQDEYDKSFSIYEMRVAVTYLQITDYIPVQWQDEEALGIEHNRSEESYMEVLTKRQEARVKIRSLNSNN